MTSENESRKKTAEEERLTYFLEMYARVTGQPLRVLEFRERPDFICARQDGSKVGIELVKVRRGHPNDILFDRLIKRHDYMSVDKALELIQCLSLDKENKRQEPDWALPNATILLIELSDIPLIDIKNRLTRQTFPDLFSYGFEDIWFADFTGLDAYDNVELFCLKPYKWAGYHPRSLQKPYG